MLPRCSLVAACKRRGQSGTYVPGPSQHPQVRCRFVTPIPTFNKQNSSSSGVAPLLYEDIGHATLVRALAIPVDVAAEAHARRFKRVAKHIADSAARKIAREHPLNSPISGTSVDG